MSRQRTIDPGWLESSVRNRTTSRCPISTPVAANASSVSVTASADAQAASPEGCDESTSSRTVASTSRAMKSARSK